jgi:cell pole-organizing protein PopZ
VIRSNFVATVAIVLPTLLAVGACASTTKQAQSVQAVDDLLTHIERVQVDATVAKDRARGALVQLTTLVSPNFAGDATKAFATLKEAIETSDKQTLDFRRSIGPMSESAESVFARWTSDLEGFGNTRMRQRSQGRLDETRARYQTVLTSAQAVLVSLEAFNADMNDQALFLASDLNAAAVQAIHPEVRELHERAKELDGRVDACSNAARAYVESAALYGQVEAVTNDTQATPNNNASNNNSVFEAAPAERPTKTKFVKQRTSTLKPRPVANSTPETAPVPVENTPETPVVEGKPENTPNPQ